MIIAYFGLVVTLGLYVRARYVESRLDGPVGPWPHDVSCIDIAFAISCGQQTIKTMDEALRRQGKTLSPHHCKQ